VNFCFHPLAEQDFDEAVKYYETCQTSLGIEFAQEVYATIDLISSYPDAWPELSKHTRRCLVNRFPYGVLFQVKSGVLRIIAVSNLHRHPGYWHDRL